MNIIKPNSLNKGDTIAIVATSGCIDDNANLLRATTLLKNMGYNVIHSKNLTSKFRYLAGSDKERLKEIHELFSNKEIKAILCLRGGYGSIRLIEDIDYELIKNNPKIFCGYSDITALSLMMLKKSNLMTYSGPMIQSDFGVEKVNKYTIDSFFNAINNNELTYYGNKCYKSGQANGILWGGNLSTIASLCGQNFIPDEDFIFFTEDINEPLYKIDKMFTQLINIKIFKNNIKGIVLGDFIGTDNAEWYDEVITDISENLGIPIAAGFKITHNDEKITLPIGAKAKLSDFTLHIKK